MLWLTLLAGLFTVHLASLLPAGAATVCKVVGVIILGLGALVAASGLL